MTKFLEKDHKTIRDLRLYQSLPIFQWTTVWPFLILYAVTLLVWVCPSLFLPQQVITDWERYLHYGSLLCFASLIFLNVLCGLATVWSVTLCALLRYRKVGSVDKASHVLILTHENRGSSIITPIIRDTSGVYFNFQNRRWIWNAAAGFFCKPLFPSKNTMKEYKQAKGHDSVDSLLITYGKNCFTVFIPEFWDLFVEHAMAPFFIFQMFCVVLWCLDEYWMYSIFTGFMLVLFECSVVFQRRRNMSTLRQMAEVPTSKIYALRKRTWEKIDSSLLVPGDVISVSRTGTGVGFPCDALIIEGVVVASEALLTGESTPQMKESIALSDDAEKLHMKHSHRHIVFGGTSVISSNRDAQESWSDAPAGAIAFVVKTGYETQQGKLIRTIVHSQSRLSSNNAETFGFIFFLLMFAIAACGYVLKVGIADPSRSRWKMFLTCTRIITSVVPPELPMELSLAVNTSLINLIRMRVYCTEPFRIPFAGKVDYCCFDKTGTLTCDNILLDSVDDGNGLVKALNAKDEIAQVLGSCHSLVSVGSEAVGDTMEKAALEAVGWCLKGADKVGDVKGKKSFSIALRYPFSSELKRMSVVATQTVGGKEERIVLTKGAPEVIRGLLETVPTNYDTYVQHSRKGYRVIALAMKRLDSTVLRSEFMRTSRTDVENKLSFVGFALFSSPIKPDAKKAISNLQQSSHRCVMITGDNELTAIAVAKQLNMVEPQSQVPTLVLVGGEPKWVNYDTNEVVPAETIPPKPMVLCVNGEALVKVVARNPSWIVKVASRVSVWARCTPDQKEAVVLALKKLGRHVLVAGDGTNDVAALKQAHVGVAVLNAQGNSEASDNDLDPLDVPVVPPEPLLSKTASVAERMRYKMEIEKRRMLIGQRETILRINELRKSGRPTPAPSFYAKDMDSMDTHNAPITRLGDASIASPFTSKSSRVNAVCDIVRMGRCTLVSTLQMFKILALNSLISAYSMSVLYTDGVKFGDTQMVVVGLVITVCFLFVSRAQPLEELSKERPFTRVFCPYMMISTVGQFAIHLTSLVYAVNSVHSVDETARSQLSKTVDDPTFKPHLLNSVVFILSTMMTVTTFAVNYRGAPFMTPLRKNKQLLYSILLLVLWVVIATTDILQGFNEYMEIVPMPSDEFRMNFLSIMAVDAVLSYSVEAVCLLLFRDVKGSKALE